MPKNYIYRVDHDTGFAPNIASGLCSLCGCKKITIEQWSQKGSWVIGIGGNNTGKPNKLIYAMEVEENLLYTQFKNRFPRRSKYLEGRCKADAPVLISRKFYYFGDKAIGLPKELDNIMIHQHGCKCISKEDIEKLHAHIKSVTKGAGFGSYGLPNNATEQSKRCKRILKGLGK